MNNVIVVSIIRRQSVDVLLHRYCSWQYLRGVNESHRALHLCGSNQSSRACVIAAHSLALSSKPCGGCSDAYCTEAGAWCPGAGRWRGAGAAGGARDAARDPPVTRVGRVI